MLPEWSLIFSVFLVACASLGKAFLVAGGGLYLAKLGVLTPEVKMGKICVKLCVPCLLWGRLIEAANWQMLEEAWIIMPFAILYISLGCLLGYACWLFSGSPVEQRGMMIAAIGFPNSQGLPIMLIEVIAPALFPEPGASKLGVAYVALYLIPYLVLQWTLGATLMRVPVADPEEDSDAKASALFTPTAL